MKKGTSEVQDGNNQMVCKETVKFDNSEDSDGSGNFDIPISEDEQ